MVRLTPADYRMQIASPLERSIQGYQAGFGQMQALSEAKQQKELFALQKQQAEAELAATEQARQQEQMRQAVVADIITRMGNNQPVTDQLNAANLMFGKDPFASTLENITEQQKEANVIANLGRLNALKTPEQILQYFDQQINATAPGSPENGIYLAYKTAFERQLQQDPEVAVNTFRTGLALETMALTEGNTELQEQLREMIDGGTSADPTFLKTDDIQEAIVTATGGKYTTFEDYAANSTPEEQQQVARKLSQIQAASRPAGSKLTEAQQIGFDVANLAVAQGKITAGSQEYEQVRLAAQIEYQEKTDPELTMGADGGLQLGQTSNILNQVLGGVNLGTGNISAGGGGGASSNPAVNASRITAPPRLDAAPATPTAPGAQPATPLPAAPPTLAPTPPATPTPTPAPTPIAAPTAPPPPPPIQRPFEQTNGDIQLARPGEFNIQAPSELPSPQSIYGSYIVPQSQEEIRARVYDVELKDGRQIAMTSLGPVAQFIPGSDEESKVDNSITNLLVGLEAMYQLRDSPQFDNLYGQEGRFTEEGTIIGTIGDIFTRGSPLADARANLTQIEALQFVIAYDALKGAGQITEFEVQSATNAQTNLKNTRQSAEQARQELNNLIARTELMVMKAAGALSSESYNRRYGNSGIPQSNPQIFRTSRYYTPVRRQGDISPELLSGPTTTPQTGTVRRRRFIGPGQYEDQ